MQLRCKGAVPAPQANVILNIGASHPWPLRLWVFNCGPTICRPVKRPRATFDGGMRCGSSLAKYDFGAEGAAACWALAKPSTTKPIMPSVESRKCVQTGLRNVLEWAAKQSRFPLGYPRSKIYRRGTG